MTEEGGSAGTSPSLASCVFLFTLSSSRRRVTRVLCSFFPSPYLFFSHTRQAAYDNRHVEINQTVRIGRPSASPHSPLLSASAPNRGGVVSYAYKASVEFLAYLGAYKEDSSADSALVFTVYVVSVSLNGGAFCLLMPSGSMLAFEAIVIHADHPRLCPA